MAGYVDDAFDSGGVKFVVIARNGYTLVNEKFSLDDAPDREAHKAAVVRFLASGHWVPMTVGTPIAPSRRAIKAWRLDERITAELDARRMLAFIDGEFFTVPPWTEGMPKLSFCPLPDMPEPPPVMVRTIAYDAQTRLVWVVFEPESKLTRECGLPYNVHGFEMWFETQYPATFVLTPPKP